ncbi:tetrahydrofolylpolyglutamate synthase [Xylariaceae sp. FL0255]|nr:tetrahydrofolylpolyglutamate synthase [Xylariaceae sp. FL0255]
MHHVFRCSRSSIQALVVVARAKTLNRRNMAATTEKSRTYGDAIDALNTLQTPFAILQARQKAGIKPDATSIAEMRLYLKRIGYTSTDLDRLNVLHVAGTKGKGSTCAFAASILSQYQKVHGIPHKIGLFTSPHLIAVRERIRLDGVPISEELFARYFFELWDRLGEAEAREPGVVLDERLGIMPPRPIYARYLTLMSYHVFLQENVDAAVYETGLGGEYDATNIVDRPLATAISTLGIDHVFALGDTVEKIAWHKAGIMKTGSAAFSVGQLPSAAAVLEERAVSKGVSLKVLDIDQRLKGVNIRPDATYQKRNATLGIALAETALQKLDPETFKQNESALPKEFVDGLEQVIWRGRCETKTEGNISWHIDGAHTVDSLKMATRWFAEEIGDDKPGPRVLIFNQQGREEAISFLSGMLTALQTHSRRPGQDAFEHVVFCTNVTHAATGYKRDFVNHQYDPEAVKALTAQRGFQEKWALLDPKAKIEVLPTIEDAINHVRGLGGSLAEGESVQALITGSLHLVGGALSILEGVDAL